ncbi:MAG TPA: hypothetical protein VGB72_10445 [Acidobacteriota bacterium]
MRKIIFCGLVLAGLAVAPALAAMDITARGQYFRPTDKAFQDFYGSGWKAGGEIGFRLTGRLDIWAGGDYFARSGMLTFTGEDTKLTLTNLGMGIRYRLTTGPISLYAGTGILVCLFKESNPIGVASRTGVGALARTGLFLRIVRGFFIHFSLGYSYCPMKPADYNIDVGGLEGGAGLAVVF